MLVRRWNGPVICTVDMLISIAAAFIALAALIEEPTVTKADMVPPGQLSVEIFWPDDACTDVDLWVQAPGGKPVGYSSAHAAYVDFLRDDLGLYCGPGTHHYENAFTRGLPQGLYVVNLHSYSDHGWGLKPVPVEVVIQIHHEKGAAETILHKTVTLNTIGQETTIARWRLDADGHVEEGSLSDLPKPLRAQ